MIQTGKTPIPTITLLAILSISLVVNLPGLAVTPMLGTLAEVFPHTTELEKQLLTSLPNLLIIPFVLLSGKLSLSRHKIGVVSVALAIFTGCAVAYFFASSMTALIVISCILGCGAGLLIPFAAGFIADVFTGEYRMHVMGVKSGISNTSLVVATFIVGWLSHGNWHLPFAVYLICLIPLVLTPWLRKIPVVDLNSSSIPEKNGATKKDAAQKGGFYVGRLAGVIGVYSFITFSTIVVSYYCPFLVEKKTWNPSLAGTVTAVFFLFILLPGYLLPWFVRIMKSYTFVICALLMTGGMAFFAFIPSVWSMILGAALIGLGYGVCQPLIYDKASQVVVNADKATLSLSFVLASNYVAIALVPFIIDGVRGWFHDGNSGTFAFIFCFVLLVIFTVTACLLRKKFAFSVDKSYYNK